MLPLYRSVRQACAEPDRQRANASLIFDKLVNVWSVAQACWEVKSDEKKKFLESFKGDGYAPGDLLSDHIERRGRHVEAIGGRLMKASTEWRFVSGLGAAHPLETGFVWHRTLGVPYLPGSSVKGMMRAWADPKRGWGASASEERVAELFGSQDGAGRLVVFDALPLKAPRLELDILNIHYQPYYKGGAEQSPPADYLSPVLVYFLTVGEGQPFEFALAPRQGIHGAAADVDEGICLLDEALRTLGAGARTATGYGRFVPQAPPEAPAPDAGVQALRNRIASYRERDYSQLSGWVDEIGKLQLQEDRAELSSLLHQKVFTTAKSRNKAEGKLWYLRLRLLMETGSPQEE